MKNEDPRRAGQGAAGAKDVDPFEQRQSTSPPVSFQLTRKVDWALEHAKRGWHVIPLAWPVDGRCSCGNANARHLPNIHSPGTVKRTQALIPRKSVLGGKDGQTPILG
jgi:hypothetical protein